MPDNYKFFGLLDTAVKVGLITLDEANECLKAGTVSSELREKLNDRMEFWKRTLDRRELKKIIYKN